MNTKTDEIRSKREQTVANLRRYLSGIMGLFYVCTGVLFYFYPVLQNLGEDAKLLVCLGLVAYGFFRLYRVFNQ